MYASCALYPKYQKVAHLALQEQKPKTDKLRENVRNAKG